MHARTAAPTPARQVAGFIARFDPKVAALAAAARRALRAKFPTAIELVYDNYNALAMGLSPTERTSDVFVTVAVYASGVNLYFMYGKHLPDPEGLLLGSGNQGRFIRLTAVKQLATPAVRALLREAIRFGETPLPKSGRGKTIVKSISAKQRPRQKGTA